MDTRDRQTLEQAQTALEELAKALDSRVLEDCALSIQDVLRPKTTPLSGTAVEVRIAVSVSPNGKWAAAGQGDASDHEDVDTVDQLGHNNGVDALHWVVATVPLPANPDSTDIHAIVEEVPRG